MLTVRFLSLIIENFKSFQGQHTFRFPTAPGLYFMAGNNLRDASIGGNGTGKTSVWDALFWVLYGRSVGGMKAKSLLNRQTSDKGYAVTLDLSIGESGEEDIYELRRTWNPNSLQWRRLGTEDWTELTNEEVVQWVRLSSTQFLTSVLFGQGQPSFLDLSAPDRAALFDDILDLDYWNRLSDFAGEQEREVMQRFVKLDRDIAYLEGVLTSLPTLESLRANMDQWDEERQLQVTSRKEMIEERRKDCRLLVAKKNELTQTLQNLSKEMAALEQGTDPFANDLSSLQAEKAVLCSKYDDSHRNYEFYEKNTTCSTCQQSITDEFRSKMMKQLKRERVELDVLWNTLVRKEEALNERRTQWAFTVGEQRKQRASLETRRNTLNRELGVLETRLDQMVREGKTLLAELDRMENETNPYLKVYDESQKTRQETEEALTLQKKEWNEQVLEKEMCAFWKDHFRKIRIFLSGQILSQLTFDVQMALGQLGLPQWTLQLSSEEVLQSGKKKTAISIRISDGSTEDRTPWESSGGEHRRLALATSMGLSSFIQRLAGVHIPFEVWDEPTDGLSKEGIQDLIQFLSDWSRMSHSQVWVVDHSIHSAGLFDGICTIEKDPEGGSHILPLVLESD